MPTVRLRYFASARAATGVDEHDLVLPEGSTIDDALSEALAQTAPDAVASLGAVLARCSFLVNAVSTTDRSTVLDDTDRVDVMPPFAGG